MSIVSSLTGSTSNTSSTSSSSSSSSSGSSSSNNASALSSLTSNYNTFLQLLTTQMQNQDPTSPMDTNQFTTELVQFAQTEQAINQTNDLGSLITLQQNSAIGTSLGYIGHTVTASGDSFSLDGSSGTNLTYSLPSAASNVTITVSNSEGQAVAQFAGTTTQGSNSVAFNGDDIGGEILPAGAYTYAIQATDASGNAINATTYTTGTVTGVDNNNGTSMLQLGNVSINASSVLSVS